MFAVVNLYKRGEDDARDIQRAILKTVDQGFAYDNGTRGDFEVIPYVVIEFTEAERVPVAGDALEDPKGGG